MNLGGLASLRDGAIGRPGFFENPASSLHLVGVESKRLSEEEHLPTRPLRRRQNLRRRIVVTADGHDLNELLVSAEPARICSREHRYRTAEIHRQLRKLVPPGRCDCLESGLKGPEAKPRVR